jgi:hypothetical protein
MRHRTRTFSIAAAAIVAIAGAIFAYVTNAGSAGVGSWKTAAGVSLQVPTTGTPRLAFTVQPGAGARIRAQGTFAVSVAIQDGFGTVVTSDSTDKVTLAIGHNPGHAGLACASPGGIRVPVSAGVATFTGCAITKAGTGYTLTATSSVSPALKAPANARPFDIITGPAARVTSTTAPGSGPASTAGQGAPGASRPAAGSPGGSARPGAELAITSPPVTGTATGRPTIGPLTVQLRTAAGAPVSTGITVQLSASSTGTNEFSASNGGSPVTSVVIPAGSSSASFYYGDEAAGTPAITVSAAGVTSDTQAESIGAGPAAGLSFTGVTTGNVRTVQGAAVTCTGTVGAASFACSLTPEAPGGAARFMTARVTLIDQFQNQVTNPPGAGVTVSLSQSGGSSLSGASVSIPARSASSALFTENLAHGKAQGTVSARATLGSVQTAASLTS